MRTVKRTALVCVACLMAAASAAAQTVTAGVKAGFVLNSIPNAGQVIDQITGIESVDVSAKLGLTAGGFVQFAFNEQFSLQPEMQFIMKGVNLDLEDNIGNASATVNYLELPLFMRFNRSLNDTLRGFVMAGPAFSVKVGTGGTLDGVKGAIEARDFDIDPAIGSRDFGLAFAGGLEWEKFLVEVRYVLGLTDIATDIYVHEDELTESDVQHHGRIAAALDRFGSEPAPLSSGAVGQTDPPTSPEATAQARYNCAGRNGRIGPSRRISVHPRHPAVHVPRPALDDAAVRGVRDRGGVQRPLSVPPGGGGHAA